MKNPAESQSINWTAKYSAVRSGKQGSPALSKLVTGHNDTSPHQCEDDRGEEKKERGEKTPLPRSGASAGLVGARLLLD